MARRPPRRIPQATRVEAALRELYATIPSVDCSGRCWDSCGRIFMTGHEQRRLHTAGYTVQNTSPGQAADPLVCPALTLLKRCGAHHDRPTICRLWGVTQGMVCSYGCRPQRLLTWQEMYEVLARAYELAGEHQLAELCRAPFADPSRHAQAIAYLEGQEQQRLDASAAREALAVRDGSALWVNGQGQLTRTRPAGMA